MTTRTHQLSIGGISVAVVRKDIKNLHVGVYPPDGRVRVAAPVTVSDAAVRAAVAGKLGWIKRQRRGFENQPRESAREMVSGETHYYLGRRYRLRVVVENAPRAVSLRGQTMEIRVRPGDDAMRRRELLDEWYREQLRALLPPLLKKWGRKVGAHAEAFGIKRMKTKWGACSVGPRRIWLNLELAKKPVGCLEYLVVHELVHLRFHRHDEQFLALIDRLLPRWKQTRRILNATSLAHAEWKY
ncbi:MAG: SprT family zinc-dependent metalloprotease [Thermoanaerobaculia bacterium]